MKHTLGTAAKATGVSRSTVLRSIKTGKISADKDANGNYAIDPSELHRVFPPVSSEPDHKTALLLHATDERNALETVLLEKIGILEKERERERGQLQETITDLRNRLDQADKERRETQEKLTALLTYKPNQEQNAALEVSQNKGKLWEKLFGRGKK
jgi:hypothetical protein